MIWPSQNVIYRSLEIRKAFQSIYMKKGFYTEVKAKKVKGHDQLECDSWESNTVYSRIILL